MQYLVLFKNADWQWEIREFVTLKLAKEYVKNNLTRGQSYSISRIITKTLAE